MLLVIEGFVNPCVKVSLQISKFISLNVLYAHIQESLLVVADGLDLTLPHSIPHHVIALHLLKQCHILILSLLVLLNCGPHHPQLLVQLVHIEVLAAQVSPGLLLLVRVEIKVPSLVLSLDKTVDLIYGLSLGHLVVLIVIGEHVTDCANNGGLGSVLRETATSWLKRSKKLVIQL